MRNFLGKNNALNSVVAIDSLRDLVDDGRKVGWPVEGDAGHGLLVGKRHAANAMAHGLGFVAIERKGMVDLAIAQLGAKSKGGEELVCVVVLDHRANGRNSLARKI